MLALLGEYWRIAVVVLAGTLLLAVRRRAPRWVVAAYGLLVAAVLIAWLVDMTWRGTLVVFAGLVLISSAFWLRREENREETRAAAR
jgi:membrane protein implicated in regulation of membrane protease activity